jgi:hypothetical protein
MPGCWSKHPNCMFSKSLLKYRVIQEESSIFGEVIISVLVRKKVHMNMSNSEWLPW